MEGNKMKVGFTGTRLGLSGNQTKKLINLLKAGTNFTDFIHGDCVGADEDAAELARKQKLKLICCPPTKDEYRAFVKSDIMIEPASYLTRNRTIVDMADYMIACPANDSNMGGTWYTIRCAQEQDKNLIVIMPDGEIRATGPKFRPDI